MSAVVSSSSRAFDPWRIVGIVALALLFVFVALPVLALLRQSLVGQDCECLSVENYTTFFTSRYFSRALFNSLVVSTGATLIALAIGLPLAIVLSRYRLKGGSFLKIMIVMSMLSPPFVGAYAWILLFGRAGFVTQLGRDWFGVSLPTIYGPFGIALASALNLYPVVFFIVSGALQRIDTSLEDAAAGLGRAPAAVFATITLPLVMPSLVTSALLVFLGTISDFGTANILGEGERYPVLATLAFALYLSEIGSEPGMAATTSMVLLAIALGLVLLVRFLSGRRSVAADGGQPRRPMILGGRKTVVVTVLAFGLVAFANLPLFIIVGSSFLEVKGAVFQWSLSLGNYEKAYALMGNALLNSILFSLQALAIILVAGAMLGYYVSRFQGQLPRLVDGLVTIPYVIPGTVLGIGYASLFNGPPFFLTGTSAIIVIVYVVRRLPYLVRSSSGIVYQIDRGLEEASQSLGVRPMEGFLRIMVPLMRPGLVAGLIIAWLEVFNELSASIVLYTGATRTLPIAAFQQAFSGDIGIAAAYSSIMILVTALALLMLVRQDGVDSVMR